jgi:hypothetical protein
VCLKARFVPSAVTQRVVPKGKRLPKRSPGPILNLISLPGGILAIHRGKLFYRLAQQAVAIEPVTLDKILHPEKKQARKLPPRKAPERETSAIPLAKQAAGT